MTQEHQLGRGSALAVVSAATFGTSGVFATALLAAGWTSGAAVTTRVVLAALVLTVPALLQLRRTPVRWRAEWRTQLVYGLFAVAVAQLCYFNAVHHLSVGVALLLEYSGSLLVVGWTWLVDGRPPSRLTAAGMAVALAGLVLVLEVWRGSSIDLVGVTWGMGAAVGLAVYFVISSRTGSSLPPLVSAWAGLAVGGIGLAAAAAVGALPFSATTTDVTLAHTRLPWLVPVLGLALVAAVVAYCTGIAAARLLGATLATFVGLAEVLFAVVFAWLLLGQEPHAVQAAGGVLVLAGIVLVRLGERPVSERAAPSPQAGAARVRTQQRGDEQAQPAPVG
ncbi:threonine/homoserine efflux transporter RhtA [Motilibacter peucedani]|uniref:Threonine/homoserine efflux transporter RhtA n=1 Tax=Motilibacter peucedani TaxID=598650 RepID=A0A420XN79_9ACTN|nr:EamA family transporter [Motilibacter peucedani]RKS72740.1 threonine/homoserine efflux transporter RhtA [Motilibacter peucedani]